MNDLNTTLTHVNRILSGERTLEVKAGVSNTDLAKIGTTILVSVFVAVALAHLITRK